MRGVKTKYRTSWQLLHKTIRFLFDFYWFVNFSHAGVVQKKWKYFSFRNSLPPPLLYFYLTVVGRYRRAIANFTKGFFGKREIAHWKLHDWRRQNVNCEPSCFVWYGNCVFSKSSFLPAAEQFKTRVDRPLPNLEKHTLYLQRNVFFSTLVSNRLQRIKCTWKYMWKMYKISRWWLQTFRTTSVFRQITVRFRLFTRRVVLRFRLWIYAVWIYFELRI